VTRMKKAILLLILFVSASYASTNYTSNKEYTAIYENLAVEILQRVELVASLTTDRFEDKAQSLLNNEPSSSFGVYWGMNEIEDGNWEVFIRCGYKGQTKANEINGLIELLNNCHEYITAEFEKQ